jgi:hypothetical protein
MMFAIQHKFKEDVADIRVEARPKHIKYLTSAGDRLKMAGPMMVNDTGDEPSGSLIVIDADSQRAAELFAENDPYVLSEMVESTTVQRFIGAIGEWIGE